MEFGVSRLDYKTGKMIHLGFVSVESLLEERLAHSAQLARQRMQGLPCCFDNTLRIFKSQVLANSPFELCSHAESKRSCEYLYFVSNNQQTTSENYLDF